MTIVDISDLDTFIRDSLFEVRRGIANSRNATQANPMLGVMVDLPEKIDFEVMVTTAHQGLTRSVISSDSDNSSEVTAESQKSGDGTTESAISSGRSNSANTSSNTEVAIEVQQDHSKESGKEDRNSQDGESMKSKSSSDESSSDSDAKDQSSAQSQSDTKNTQSRQVEQHAEANDRASRTFDEDEGTWGGQGQLSTPNLPVTPCSCS